MQRKISVFALGLYASASALTCLDESGAASPFWAIFKEPQSTSYLFYDRASGKLAPSSNDLNSTTDGALALTMSQLWGSQSLGFIMYNDDPAPPNPLPYNFSWGHTKGVWAWSGSEAILLIHSIPKFPQTPAQVPSYNGLFGNSWTYGQNIACFTLSSAALNTLAATWQLTLPNIYGSSVPAGTPANLAALANGAFKTDASCLSVPFTAAAGSMTLFAKSTQWNSELYSKCVAPGLKDSLLVESWKSALSAACGTYGVLDVAALQYTPSIGFSEADDHSKWAIGASKGSATVCASDINRVSSQYARGGGAICFQDEVLAAALRGAVTNTQNTC